MRLLKTIPNPIFGGDIPVAVYESGPLYHEIQAIDSVSLTIFSSVLNDFNDLLPDSRFRNHLPVCLIA
jgi:hypothetical protein